MRLFRRRRSKMVALINAYTEPRTVPIYGAVTGEVVGWKKDA